MTAVSPTTTAQAVARHPRPTYTRIALTGLLLLAAAPGLMVALALATGLSGDELAMFAVAAALLATTAFLVWRFGTWAKALAIAIALLAGFGGFWLAFGLAYPASFGDFIPAVLFITGMLLAVGGSVAAIVKRNDLRVEATPREQRIVTGAVAVVALAAIASAGLWMVSRAAVDATAASAASTMKDFAFEEEAYELSGGDTLVVHNADGFVHDFTVHDLGIAETVLPGSDALIEVPNEPGTYTIYCTLHSSPEATDAADGDMVATLTVE